MGVRLSFFRLSLSLARSSSERPRSGLPTSEGFPDGFSFAASAFCRRMFLDSVPAATIFRMSLSFMACASDVRRFLRQPYGVLLPPLEFDPPDVYISPLPLFANRGLTTSSITRGAIAAFLGVGVFSSLGECFMSFRCGDLPDAACFSASRRRGEGVAVSTRLSDGVVSFRGGL